MGLRALDKKTGQVKWEQNREPRNTMSTPVLIRIQDRIQLIYHAGGVRGIDPATGDVLWSCGAPTSQSSPVYGRGLLYADESGGTNPRGVVIDPTGKGDVSKTHVKWQTRVGPAPGSSGVIVGEYVYCNVSKGPGRDFIGSRALQSGELVHEEETPRITNSAASPVATPDGRIYFAGSGRSYVIQAGAKFKILAVNDLDDGNDYTSAAIAGGRIFIKGRWYLWCIGKK
jgi:outer membrane protein assembly factor BamB